MSEPMIITEEMLKNLDKVTCIQGLILCRDYNVAPTKNGGEYINGTLTSGINVSFKCWSTSSAFTTLKTEDYKGKVAFINGKVDKYNGIASILVDTISAVDYDTSAFLPKKYDADTYWNYLMSLLQANVSENAMQLVQNIFTPEVKARFMIEFAAKSHHDACVSGLLAHTVKVMILTQSILSLYPRIINNDQNFKDIIFMGVLLHDIGKTNEMNMGVYNDLAFVTHRYYGLEYIMPFKEHICQVWGEKNYYNLVSIITQHHGKYGEPCQSLASYIVHSADMLDSIYSVIVEDLESGLTNLKVDEFKVTV